MKEELDQSKTLLHIRFEIIGDICSLSINVEISINVVPCTLIDLMKLPTQRNSKPYKVQWYDDSGLIEVTKQVVISFKVDKYQYEVQCDVMPLRECYVLLGRPWKDGRSVQYRDKSNKYILVFGG